MDIRHTTGNVIESHSKETSNRIRRRLRTIFEGDSESHSKETSNRIRRRLRVTVEGDFESLLKETSSHHRRRLRHTIEKITGTNQKSNQVFPIPILSLVTRHLSLIITRHLSLIITRHLLLVTLSLVTCHLSLFSCSSRNPNLSERQLHELSVDTASTVSEEQVLQADKGNAVVPGIRYKEKRSVDPAHPPIVIDIEKAIQRPEDIPLSSIGKNLQYITATIPKDFRMKDFVIRDDTLFISCSNADITAHYIFPYNMDGKFLNLAWEITPKGITKKHYPDITANTEKIELIPAAKQPAKLSPPTFFKDLDSEVDGTIIKVEFDHTGRYMCYNIARCQQGGKQFDKHVVAPLQQGTPVNYTVPTDIARRFEAYYQPKIGWIQLYRTVNSWLKKEPYCLYTLSPKGDTLCCFANHNPYTPFKVAAFSYAEPLNAYYSDNLFTFRTDYANTIYRLKAPDRIVPVYVLHAGQYKIQATEGLKGKVEGKVCIGDICETKRFLLVTMNALPVEKDGIDRIDRVLVFDKIQGTTRLNRKKGISGNHGFSNDVDKGPDFYPEKVMPGGKTLACHFTPGLLKKTLAPGKLLYGTSMSTNQVLLMFVE